MNLDKSQYNINSARDFYGYLETFLLSLDPNLTFDQANSHLVFYLSFVTQYIDIPTGSSRNTFSIILSGDAEEILYKSARLLIRSMLFKTLSLKTFLISKLLSMLNLNVQLDNINLKMFLGFIFILLIKEDDKNSEIDMTEQSQRKLIKNSDDDANQSKFSINDLEMEEDEDGTNVGNLDASILDVLNTYSPFKIFYKILYFNNFIDFYSIRRNSVFKKYLESPENTGTDQADKNHSETIQQHTDAIKFYDLNYMARKSGSTLPENLQYSRPLEQELTADEHYYLTNCLIKDKSLISPDTSLDIDSAIESLSEEELTSPKNTDIILQRIINNDSEFRSITHQYKRILISKVYMKLISNYLKLNSLTFIEIIFVNSDFVVNYLLKNLSIFENGDYEEESLGDPIRRRNKRTSMRIDEGFYNDALSKGLTKFDDYKKFLKQVNKAETKNINDLKFELALVLNEQYMVMGHSQLSLQKQYDKNILSKLLYYKHLKLIQIKTEIASIQQSKLQMNDDMDKTFNTHYKEKLKQIEKLQAEQKAQIEYYGYCDQVEYLVDIDDLYEKVSVQFAENLNNLTTFETKFSKMRDLFESNQFLCSGDRLTDESNLSEFIRILRKENSQFAEGLTPEKLVPYLTLLENEVLAIIRPQLHNLIFEGLIGLSYRSVAVTETHLKEALSNYLDFVSFLIYNFNRQSNNCNKILILKILYLIFKELKKNDITKNDKAAAVTKMGEISDTALSKRASIFSKTGVSLENIESIKKKSPAGACDFYINDLKVLVDIFIRELYDLSPDTQLPVINNYLRVFFLLLNVTQLNYLKFSDSDLRQDIDFNFDKSGYKRREILELLLYLSGLNVNDLAKLCHENNGRPPDITAMTSQSTLSLEHETTKHLAKKCLSIRWLGLNSYVIEKMYQNFEPLSPQQPNNEVYASPLSRTSTANSLSSSSASMNNFVTNSSERLTLSKKLSNLRLTNNNTGGSNRNFLGLTSPLITSPLNHHATIGQHYGNIYEINEPVAPPLPPYTQGTIKRSNVTNSEPDIHQQVNGHSGNEMLSPPGNVRRFERHSSSNINLMHSPVPSCPTSGRRKPPPPVPPVYSRDAKDKFLSPGMPKRKEKRSPPPPPPPPPRSRRVA